jgi:hypothetical protein
MARNKTTKRNMKRHAKENTSTISKKMEKDLFKVPARIAAKVNKEVSQQKQKESKLKKVIDKVRIQVRNAEARIKAAASSNNKRQLSKAKRTHKDVSKIQTELDKQLHQTSQTVFNLSNEQAKWAALHKYLNQFNKEWAKSKTKPQTLSKSKKTRGPQKSKTSFVPQQPQSGNNETGIDHTIRLDESTEVVS